MSKTITVKIAIAVGVEADGTPTYYGYGYSGCDDWDEATESFEMLDKEKRYWVIAKIPVEDDKVFEGTVSEA